MWKDRKSKGQPVLQRVVAGGAFQTVVACTAIQGNVGVGAVKIFFIVNRPQDATNFGDEFR